MQAIYIMGNSSPIMMQHYEHINDRLNELHADHMLNKMTISCDTYDCPLNTTENLSVISSSIESSTDSTNFETDQTLVETLYLPYQQKRGLSAEGDENDRNCLERHLAPLYQMNTLNQLDQSRTAYIMEITANEVFAVREKFRQTLDRVVNSSESSACPSSFSSPFNSPSVSYKTSVIMSNNNNLTASIPRTCFKIEEIEEY